MAQLLVITGTLHLIHPENKKSVRGHRVGAVVVRRVSKLGDTDLDRTLEIPFVGSAVASEDGSFRLVIGGDGEIVDPVVITASTPEGIEVVRTERPAAELVKPLNLSVEGLVLFEIQAGDNAPAGSLIRLQGRVIDLSGNKIPAGVPVLLFGVDKIDGGGMAEARLLEAVKTQADGYFSAAWVADIFVSAFARVQGGPPSPIRLDGERLPRNLILAIEGLVPPGANETTPPRSPDPLDLTNNPAAFSQDLGNGCVRLSMANRTLEEFSYFTVVRTTEPEVMPFRIRERRPLPPGTFGDLIVASSVGAALSRRTVSAQEVNSLRGLTLDVRTAQRMLTSDQPPTIRELSRAAWLSETAWAKDLLGTTVKPAELRTFLDDEHKIDYESPTIYQAVTLAQGHLLQFREVWRADGFSLGDLLSSLPLAPGQRKQVAIVDWTHRTTGQREESLEFEEALNSFVSRDRDVSEIVGSKLSEEVAGGSRNTTYGGSSGIGGGFINGVFGIFGGISGGASGSNTESWQDASRAFSGQTMQNLRDRVLQRSSSVRDQRATVVQTVAQSDTVRAETEVIANYNRCHTMTVEYFEVLRHFLVTHELADVRECLFVPFAITAFDRARALRWREFLSRYLRDKSLLPAFAALERVADNWEGWDYPEARYSEEAPESLEGELRISFVLPRPRDGDDAKFQIDMWRAYSPYLNRDALELWTAAMSEKSARERDRYFRENVAPGIATQLVARMQFSYVTSSGNTVDVLLDGTLVSRYAEGTPLYVSLNPAGGLPPTPREEITAFQIRAEGAELPQDARVIVHSGKLRYRTAHYTSLLFNEPRILNDLRSDDAVVISTPLRREEIRNPRAEDRDLGDRLVRHLNEHLEFYQQALLMSLDSERRMLLLDAIIVPGTSGLSVASLVENRLIGIAGNSMILPLAPGRRLDPRIAEGQEELRAAYEINRPPPLRISVPTRGVYAEAVLGDCAACEPIDDTRYWRWSTEGLLAPPAINPVSTSGPDRTETDVKPTPFPAPLVSIQNAPELPNPTSMSDVLGLLAKSDTFRDITALTETQKNASAAFSQFVSNAEGISQTAFELAKQQLAAKNTGRMLDRIQKAKADGLLTPEAAQTITEGALEAMINAQTNAAQAGEDKDAQKVVDTAAQSNKAEVTVTTGGKTVQVSFDDTGVSVGGGPVPGTLELKRWVKQDLIMEIGADPTLDVVLGEHVLIRARVRQYTQLAQLPAPFPSLSDIEGPFLRKAGTDEYEIQRSLNIVYPADPANNKKLAGKGKYPVAVITHGHHKDAWNAVNTASFKGYVYLQKHLASLGIVSIAVDMNFANAFDSAIEMRAEMALGALDFARSLDNGTDSEKRFQDRLDLTRVALIGHSRGGDGMVRAAKRNKLRPASEQFGIRAVCGIAPADNSGTFEKAIEVTGNLGPAALMAAPHEPLPYSLTPADSEFLLLVYGRFDGDISGIGGADGATGNPFRHYDRATCEKAMVYIDRCNHNRFNEVWTTASGGIVQGDEDLMIPADVSKLLSLSDHQQLASEYIGAALLWKLKNDTSKKSLLNGTAVNSKKAATSIQWSFGSKLLELESMETTPGAAIDTRTLSESQIDMFGEITVNSQKLKPNVGHQTRVLAVNPNLATPPAALELKLKTGAANRNWLDYALLTLRVAVHVDVADPAAGHLPEFQIMLTDENNKSATLDQSKLKPVATLPPAHHIRLVDATGAVVVADINVTLIKLETLSVKLTDFTGIALDKIASLKLIPATSFPSYLFFDSIQIVKV